ANARAADAPPIDPTQDALAALRADWSRLVAALNAPTATPDVTLPLLEQMLARAALVDVDVRLELELALAALLVQQVPKSSELLTRAASAFGWSSGAHPQTTPQAIVAAGECARAIAYLDRLRDPTHTLHAAYRAITTPPKPLRLRLAILVSGLDRDVRRLRAFVANELAWATPQLDPAAVRWWDQYHANPRIGQSMLALCFFVPLFAAAGANAGWRLAAFAGSLVGMIAVAGFDLLVVERLRRSHLESAMAASPRRLYGWFPAGVLIAVVAALVPNTFVQTLLVAPAVGCVLWSWIVRAPLVRNDGGGSLKNLVLLNVPAGIWLLVLGRFVSVPMAVTFGALVVAHTIGTSGSLVLWMRTDQRLRRRILGVLLAAALALIAILWAAPPELHAAGAAAALVLVLLARAPSAVLTASQSRLRYWIMFFLVYGAASFFGQKESVAATIGVATWFLGGVALTCLMALSNERSRRA
ncbi:MAG TPA: hypothetical protein VFJ95_01455, partial [Gammaproteobacteria bacterium]|nr:hypothetical protein [Gammaproteobacteria bacterium]